MCLLQPPAPIRCEREISCILWWTASRPSGAFARRSKRRGIASGSRSPSCGRIARCRMGAARCSMCWIARPSEVWTFASSSGGTTRRAAAMATHSGDRRPIATCCGAWLALPSSLGPCPGACCQHQKSWIMDAGQDVGDGVRRRHQSEPAFDRIARTHRTSARRRPPQSRCLCRGDRTGGDRCAPQFRPALERGQRTHGRRWSLGPRRR